GPGSAGDPTLLIGALELDGQAELREFQPLEADRGMALPALGSLLAPVVRAPDALQLFAILLQRGARFVLARRFPAGGDTDSNQSRQGESHFPHRNQAPLCRRTVPEFSGGRGPSAAIPG